MKTEQEPPKHGPNAISIWVLVLVILFFLVTSIVALKATSNALGALVSLPIAGETGRSLLFLVAVAFVTMCLIQVLRSLVRVRGWFHIRQIEGWFQATEQVIAKDSQPTAPEDILDLEAKARQDVAMLGRLANVDEMIVFFDAPIEQVCGQISAVTEFLLSELPQPEADPGSAKSFLATSPVESSSSLEERRLLALMTGKNGVLKAGQMLSIQWEVPKPTEATGETSPASSKAVSPPPFVPKAEVRGTLGFQLQRSLDQLQIQISGRWQRLLRWAAVCISCAICLSATHLNRPFIDAQIDKSGFAGFATAMMAGIVSGYMATVFRDMIAIVERRRR